MSFFLKCPFALGPPTVPLFWSLWKSSEFQGYFLLIIRHMYKANSPFPTLSLSIIHPMNRMTPSLQLHHQESSKNFYIQLNPVLPVVMGPFSPGISGPHLSSPGLKVTMYLLNFISDFCQFPYIDGLITCFFPQQVILAGSNNSQSLQQRIVL